MENDKDEGIVADVEETNEEVEETTEEQPAKPEKPKRTPQEELEYFEGRASRLRKKLGLEAKTDEPVVETKPAPNGKPNELDYGQRAFLHSYGIKGSDELSLVRQFQERGFALDAIVEDDVFTAKLNGLRQVRESAAAVPKGKNRPSGTGVTDIDLAVAKFHETGELPADFETRRQVIDKAVVDPTKSNNALFSGK